MKIELTKREYEALLDMVCLGDCVLHGYTVGEAKDVHSKVEQKILSQAAEAGCDDRIVYDPELKKYYPTQEYEESDGIQGVLEDYENESFWGELADRMASRDLERKYGAAKLDAMRQDERMHVYFEAEDAYEREFEEHGIERLSVQSAPTSGKKKKP